LIQDDCPFLGKKGARRSLAGNRKDKEDKTFSCNLKLVTWNASF